MRDSPPRLAHRRTRAPSRRETTARSFVPCANPLFIRGRRVRPGLFELLVVLKKRGLQRDTLGPHALAERFDGEFLGNRTGEEPWQGRILASEVFSELPRSGTEN